MGTPEKGACSLRRPTTTSAYHIHSPQENPAPPPHFFKSLSCTYINLIARARARSMAGSAACQDGLDEQRQRPLGGGRRRGLFHPEVWDAPVTLCAESLARGADANAISFSLTHTHTHSLSLALSLVWVLSLSCGRSLPVPPRSRSDSCPQPASVVRQGIDDIAVLFAEIPPA